MPPGEFHYKSFHNQRTDFGRLLRAQGTYTRSSVERRRPDNPEPTCASYIICGAQCKPKMQSPLLETVKDFKVGAAEIHPSVTVRVPAPTKLAHLLESPSAATNHLCDAGRITSLLRYGLLLPPRRALTSSLGRVVIT